MRNLICLLVMVCGCSSVAGPAGPRGEPGVAADSSMIAALALRVSELEQRGAVKVPHLVADTGEDLGPFVAWDYAYSEKIGTYYRTSNRALVVYADDSCEGEARVVTGGLFDRYVAASNDHVIETSGPVEPFMRRSVFANGDCLRHSEMSLAALMTDTGAPAIVRDRLGLRVELR